MTENRLRKVEIKMAELKVEVKDLKVSNRQNFKEVKECITSIENKLDMVLKTKAEKEDLESLRNRFWWLIGILVAGGLALVIYLVERFIK